MKKSKALAFVVAVSAVMAVSSTSVFAHHGGGHCRGGYGYGYNNYSYSCPYGNATCNQQGYCINHNYVPPTYTAPTSATPSPQSAAADQSVTVNGSTQTVTLTQEEYENLLKLIEVSKLIGDSSNSEVSNTTPVPADELANTVQTPEVPEV